MGSDFGFCTIKHVYLIYFWFFVDKYKLSCYNYDIGYLLFEFWVVVVINNKIISDKYYEITCKKFFYNIMPIENINSVIKNGILSYDAANNIDHKSIAMNEVQEIRSKVNIPNGLNLHKYANLYFAYDNPMLYKKKDEAESLCILAISSRVLDIEGCVVSDRNAATALVRFYSPNEGIYEIDFKKVFAKNWIHDNYYEWLRHKAIKCAEVLIPEYIPYEYIEGAYVLNEESKTALIAQKFDKKIHVSASVFYR